MTPAQVISTLGISLTINFYLKLSIKLYDTS